MSLSLDLALFLRENHILDKNGNIVHIPAAIRGFLFTLAFRLGSNPYTWVSQDELADEMDVSVRQLQRIIAFVVKYVLIEVCPSNKDKRKNMYRLAEFFVNYHQKRRDKTKKDPWLGLTFIPKEPVDNSHDQTIYTTSMSSIHEEYTTSMSPNRRHICRVISEKNSQSINENNDLQDTASSERESKATKKSKVTNICASDDARAVFEDVWSYVPVKKNKADAFKVFVKMKIHTNPELVQRIKDDLTNKMLNDAAWLRGYIPYFKKYLINEKWTESVDLRTSSPNKKESPVERVWRLSTGRTS